MPRNILYNINQILYFFQSYLETFLDIKQG